MKKHWKTYAFWILLSEAVGGLSAFLTREGMQIYSESVVQPVFAPPDWLFPVVWTILYALMGIGATRIALSEHSAERAFALHLFCSQLAVNFFWSIIFFNLRNFSLALFWLLLLIGLVVWMIAAFRKVDRPAAWLQIPYLLWLIFAALLNAAVWMLNP
ncbi:MAG: tryptophan-rich sensory protein [Ruminococcaceae bacterium]|nr:tryptophan-rich sensory protein [Oscillospiraceae bacterium]